jgi:hypothetical protein
MKRLTNNNLLFESLVIQAISTESHFPISKILIKHLGLTSAAVLCSYIDKYKYYKSKFPENKGWFFFTHEQQMETFGVGDFSIRKTMSDLRNKGIIKTKMIGLPAKEWISLDFNKISEYLIEKVINGIAPQESTELPRKNQRNINNNKYNKNKIYISSEEDPSTILNQKITSSMFSKFCELYPHSRIGSKGKALTIWNRICTRKNLPPPTWREIKFALKSQMKSEQWQSIGYIPLMTTWLNQNRWLDDSSQLKSYSNENDSDYCDTGEIDEKFIKQHDWMKDEENS